MSDTAFVTGGSSLVGHLLIARLVAEGTRVFALARSARAVEVVRGVGAEPVLGELARPDAWATEAQSADHVFHLALPRLRPPVRRRGMGGLAREAASGAATLRSVVGSDRPVTMASTGLVFGDRETPAGDGDVAAPLALARPAHAAEIALADPELRIVRLGWVYGAQGVLFDLAQALAARRLRVVGPGENRWALIAADDAAGALLAASGGPAGAYGAAEPGAPTQIEVIHHLCEAAGLRRPDHIPPAMAAFTLGGAMAAALLASMDLRADRLATLGWHPEADWHRDLPTAVGLSGTAP